MREVFINELARKGYHPQFGITKDALEAFDLAIRTVGLAQRPAGPWKGNLSVDLRRGSLRVNADGVALIDEAGTCWAIVFPDKNGFYDHAATIVAALSDTSTLQSVPVQHPPHNSGERLPSSDAAGAGTDTSTDRTAPPVVEPNYRDVVRQWFELRLSQKRDIATSLGLPAQGLSTDIEWGTLVLMTAKKNGELARVAAAIASALSVTSPTGNSK
jgi:hypothetical protein